MRVCYSDTFNLPLPEGHRCPGQKYAMLRAKLLRDGLVAPDELHLSPLAGDADIARAHDAEYVAAYANTYTIARRIHGPDGSVAIRPRNNAPGTADRSP